MVIHFRTLVKMQNLKILTLFGLLHLSIGLSKSFFLRGTLR